MSTCRLRTRHGSCWSGWGGPTFLLLNFRLRGGMSRRYCSRGGCVPLCFGLMSGWTWNRRTGLFTLWNTWKNLGWGVIGGCMNILPMVCLWMWTSRAGGVPVLSGFLTLSIRRVGATNSSSPPSFGFHAGKRLFLIWCCLSTAFPWWLWKLSSPI